MKEIGSRQVQQLQQLYDAIASICADVGCACLAERFRNISRNPGCDDTGSCPVCRSGNTTLLPHMLVKLVPLIEALKKTGYHDLALITTELALHIEPTIDLRLNYAYLALVLGENEAALQTYREVLKGHGSIPEGEITRLAELAASHCTEDDIVTLCNELRAYSNRRPA
jgi:hypothetical protein